MRVKCRKAEQIEEQKTGIENNKEQIEEQKTGIENNKHKNSSL